MLEVVAAGEVLTVSPFALKLCFWLALTSWKIETLQPFNSKISFLRKLKNSPERFDWRPAGDNDDESASPPIHFSDYQIIDILPFSETANDSKRHVVEGEEQVGFRGKKGYRGSDRDGRSVGGEEKRIWLRKQDEAMKRWELCFFIGKVSNYD